MRYCYRLLFLPLLLATALSAGSISIAGFNTGIDLVPTPDGLDDYWRVSERPSGGGVSVPAELVPEPLPAGWWPNGTSQWIWAGPEETGTGTYTFFSNFTVVSDGGEPDGGLIGWFTLTGLWGSFNATHQVKLNDVVQGKNAMGGLDHSQNPFFIDDATRDGGFPFVITGPLYQGAHNVISFKIHRDDPDDNLGLRVQLGGDIEPAEVPEPSTLVFAGLGLLLVAAARLRRKF